MDHSSIKIKSRVWIENQEGIFLGEGRINLLKAIQQFGSINKAANSMGMSYQKAWKLVQSMNSSSSESLVIKTSGGKGGGGTILTEKGEKAILFYEKINRSCQQFLDKELKKQIGEFYAD